MTPDEINRKVAAKLGVLRKDDDGNICETCIPKYSTEITAAWEIMRHCTDELFLYQVDLIWSRTGDTWYCTLGTRNQENESVGADTAPMAICLAFLKLK